MQRNIECGAAENKGLVKMREKLVNNIFKYRQYEDERENKMN